MSLLIKVTPTDGEPPMWVSKASILRILLPEPQTRLTAALPTRIIFAPNGHTLRVEEDADALAAAVNA